MRNRIKNITSTIYHYLYMPWWYLQSGILKKERPLQTVLFITDYCNLSCKHCTPEGHKGSRMKPYEEIKKELVYSYRQGSRFVDFEGGEPTLWRDGNKDLNDLYRLAKEIGFFSCTLTTNGQRPFSDTLADSVWVSVDGYGKYHDRVRGKGTFQKLDENIRNSGHPHLSIAMAVNKLNKDSVGKLVRYAASFPEIQSVAFNFHTPFPATEELILSESERQEVIEKIIRMKKRGLPIMNTVSGLKLMMKPDFKKYCWVANYIMIDGTKLPQCPGRLLNVCDECGFSMSGEMYSLLHLKIDTVLSGLKLRM